jgi:hypothetical protein
VKITCQDGSSPDSINNFTVAKILRYAWALYESTHLVEEHVRKEIERALLCRSGENGVFLWQCTECGEIVYQLLGCNSRMCSSCGKRYVDEWSKSLSRAMFKVPHGHFVMSVPSQIWPYLLKDRALWKVYMDSAIDTINDYFPKIMRNPHIKAGVIVILHPFGKDMKFQPHLHIIVTEGGFVGSTFIPRKFFPARQFAKSWQFHVSRNFQAAGLPNELFTELYRKYEGFYVWVHRAGRIDDAKDVARYLGRYVRHPAIANSRITGFDGNHVTFFYREYRNFETKTHFVTMMTYEFISALIQHIPPKQFKMIRYYGAYGRKRKGSFGRLAMSSITTTVQDTLYLPGWKMKPRCPHCGGMLKFLRFEKIPPPEDYFNWHCRNPKSINME